MARDADQGSWQLTTTQSAAFRDLRKALLIDVKDAALASELEMSASTFSLAANGKRGRAFTSAQKEYLETRLKERLEQVRRAARDDPAYSDKASAAQANFSLLFAPEQLAPKFDYVAPGAWLPLTASTYIDRQPDSLIGHRLLDDAAGAHIVMGGPRTGKSSFLRRLQNEARRSGRNLIAADVQPFLNNTREAAGRRGLTLVELVNAVAAAISGDGRPLIQQPDRDMVNLINQRFAELLARPRFADAVIIVDGFNLLVEFADDWRDANTILSCLVSPFRVDSCKIFVPDSGLIGRSDLVSEWITRAGVIDLTEFTEFDLQRLAGAVLPECSRLCRYDLDGAMSDFGPFALLHHAALHKARERLAGAKSSADELSGLLDETRRAVLQKTTAWEGLDSDDRLDRELARFGRRVSNHLAWIAQTHAESSDRPDAAVQLLHRLAQYPVEDVRPNYVIRRMLGYSGLAPDGERAPGFVRILAEKLVTADGGG